MGQKMQNTYQVIKIWHKKDKLVPIKALKHTQILVVFCIFTLVLEQHKGTYLFMEYGKSCDTKNRMSLVPLVSCSILVVFFISCFRRRLPPQEFCGPSKLLFSRSKRNIITGTCRDQWEFSPKIRCNIFREIHPPFHS